MRILFHYCVHGRVTAFKISLKMQTLMSFVYKMNALSFNKMTNRCFHGLRKRKPPLMSFFVYLCVCVYGKRYYNVVLYYPLLNISVSDTCLLNIQNKPQWA